MATRKSSKKSKPLAVNTAETESKPAKKSRKKSDFPKYFLAGAIIFVLLAGAWVIYGYYPKIQPTVVKAAIQEQIREQPAQVVEQPKPAVQQAIALKIPAEALASRFGFTNAKQNFKGISALGVKWDRPYPGPFNWQAIGYETYDWSAVDGYVKAAQEKDFQIVAVIWPYNNEDQKNCVLPIDPEIKFGDLYGTLANHRKKPCNTEAYAKFLQALVERYDGDGVKDYAELKYPIKYWEIASTPDVQETGTGKIYFQGNGEDYAKLMKDSYRTIKNTDSEAFVLNGGISSNGVGKFWDDAMYYDGAYYFDILSYQCQDCDENLHLNEIKSFANKYNLDKPVWLTDTRLREENDDAQATLLMKAYLYCFGEGVDKIFYERYDSASGGVEKRGNLIDPSGTTKKAYAIFKTLFDRLGSFEKAELVVKGVYKFVVADKIYYGYIESGDLPAGFPNLIYIMNNNGTVKQESRFSITHSDLPAMVWK